MATRLLKSGSILVVRVRSLGIIEKLSMGFKVHGTMVQLQSRLGRQSLMSHGVADMGRSGYICCAEYLFVELVGASRRASVATSGMLPNRGC